MVSTLELWNQIQLDKILLSSPNEFHFVHAGLPHARHKRSVPHSRKLKTDPQVRILFEDGDDDGDTNETPSKSYKWNSPA